MNTDGCSSYNARINNRELTLYVRVMPGKEISRRHKCGGGCGRSKDYGVVFTAEIVEIIADGYQEIKLTSKLGKEAKRRLSTLPLNGKSLCDECDIKFFASIGKELGE